MGSTAYECTTTSLNSDSWAKKYTMSPIWGSCYKPHTNNHCAVKRMNHKREEESGQRRRAEGGEERESRQKK